MFLRNSLLISLFVLPLGLSMAQSVSTKPVEPTSIGVVYRLDPSTGELKPLPDEQWSHCQHAAGIWPVFCIEVRQEHSSFHVSANENVAFVFKTGSPEKVSLYRFEQKGKNRRFDYEKRGQPIKGLPAEVTTYGERSYKLVPGSPLTPGEYAIVIAGEIYTFGVDQ